MNAAEELTRLKKEVIPAAMMLLAYSIRRLAEMERETEVDPFQLEADAMKWWHRINRGEEP